MLVLWATARPDISGELLEREVARHIRALQSIEDADVERARNLIESRHRNDLQRVDERADQLSMFTTLFDDPGRINTEIERLRAVRTEDVRALAADFLVPQNRAVLWYVPRPGAGT
jgi:predicted Zn-dependent peptidase